MASVIYFAGGEDIDFQVTGTFPPTASAGRFRPSFARGAMGGTGNTVTDFIENFIPFATGGSAFWAAARCCNSFPAGNVSGAIIMAFGDSSHIVRLRLRLTSAGVTSTFVVEKLTSGAVATSLFTGSFVWDTAATGNEATQFAFHITYAVAGSIELFYKGISLGSFSGDVTTDGVTSLAFVRLGNNGGGNESFWSECMVLDVDPRTFSLQTFAPVANGNTHNFDTGTPAAANVNEFVLNVTTLDGSTTAAQIDEYTTGAVATGTFDVIAYGVSALMTKGTSGPSKADLAVRTGAADWFSADQVLTTFYADYQNWWLTNPSTSAAWQTTQIGAAAGFNIGVKSVT